MINVGTARCALAHPTFANGLACITRKRKHYAKTVGAARVLRARRDRPCRGRAAEQCDELAPVHSMTSSAATRRVWGMMTPSVLAVLRLITNSNFVGNCTGRSAGFAPLSTRSA